MGTAVLHPQDVLVPSQGHPNRHVPLVSEYTSAALAASVSVCHGISLDCVGRSSLGTTGIRGVLGRKDSSAGLLPLPDHASRSTHTPSHAPRSTYTPSQRSSNLTPASGGGSSRWSPLNSHRRSRFPNATYESATPMQRRSFSYLDLVSHGRRRPACEVCDVGPAKSHLNSTRRTYMAAPSISAPGEVFAHPRVAPMAKTRPSHSEQQKVILLSDSTQLDSRLGKGGAKQLNDATCKSSNILARRHGGNRLLDRSTSEKIQGQCKMSASMRSSSPEVAEKLATSYPRAPTLVHYQSRREIARQEEIPAFPALSTKGNWHCRKEDVLGSFDPASDTTGWLSMIDERWAGPSFFNSPPPSALPVPTFTSKLLRTTSRSSEPVIAVDCGSSLFVDAPVPEAKRTWDVAFATKDLRRLLHLDHARCDARRECSR